MSTLKKAAQVDLKSYMERIERLEEERKELVDDIRSIYAEAKAAGFDTKALRSLIKLRKKDATERQEEEALLDTYMHAVGMATEAPLFAAVGAMGTDTAARDQVIEAFKLLVPATGEVIIKMGGSPVRLWRDDSGKAHAADYVEPETPPAPEKTGKALKTPAAVLKMVPKSRSEATEAPSTTKSENEAETSTADARAGEKEPEPA